MLIFCPNCGESFETQADHGRLTCPHCDFTCRSEAMGETMALTTAQLASTAREDAEVTADVAVEKARQAAKRSASRPEVICANCNLPFVPEDDATCPYCNTRAERDSSGATRVLATRGAAPGASAATPLGELALGRGFISDEDLATAIGMHQEKLKSGSKLPLGEMMVGAGFISRAQLEALLAAQGGRPAFPVRLKGYEIIKQLGEGAWGEVVLARQLAGDRLVALKILRKEMARDPDYVERFIREGRLAYKLDHPNIVSAIDVGESAGTYYFAMEYVEGRSLRDFMARERKLPEPFALHLMIQIARALEYANENDIVHRDVKPDNILMDGNGVPKLADLGLAKEVGSITRITQTGVMMGTPHYMSPEQARGVPLDIRSDIYSLGATLYCLLTGRPPFEGSSAAVILTKHLTEQVPWPQDINPNVSENCCLLIEKMMAKEPRERYATPAELIPDLELVENGKAPQGERPAGRSSIGESGSIQVKPRPLPVQKRKRGRARGRDSARATASKPATPAAQSAAVELSLPGGSDTSITRKHMLLGGAALYVSGMLLGVIICLAFFSGGGESPREAELHKAYIQALEFYAANPGKHEEARQQFENLRAEAKDTEYQVRAQNMIKLIDEQQH
jgi:eukaryotic-like serine/threonine-protein kinase